MAETFKIVERLKAAEIEFYCDPTDTMERHWPAIEARFREAAALLQALGEAIEPFVKARDNAEKVALLGPAAVDMACSSKVNASDFDRARSVYSMLRDNGVTARPTGLSPAAAGLGREDDICGKCGKPVDPGTRVTMYVGHEKFGVYHPECQPLSTTVFIPHPDECALASATVEATSAAAGKSREVAELDPWLTRTLKEAKYILANNAVEGDVWAGRIRDDIDAILTADERSRLQPAAATFSPNPCDVDAVRTETDPTLYVDRARGSDGNQGTQADPVATVQKAADILQEAVIPTPSHIKGETEI